MKAIEWFGTHFIQLFEAGAETFMGFMTGIIPLLIVLLTFTNSLIALIGQDRVDRIIRKSAKYTLLRYTVMPILSVLLLTNPMAYTFGKFLKEEQKPAFYDSAVSFVHPVTGLFPYANAGELFVYLGIANGVMEAGFDQGSLAVRYFLVGVIVILMRGIVTEWITKMLIKKASI
ncbi:PTS system, glucitol/sorbitol-specific IIC component [Halolactibacillus halophilus]|uniref:PTS sorbitol transporter subunit IIC n=1 Tax=Halolactibacillus halophilus TaxID=306540 RepID=A0A1I5R3K6_9BACI|nr:PTS glucitol/sorbitol transporter subunit IIC [Halolactibacillus halophilus]GEM02715.1 PTS sorbitol transporter subunit IIC [Halolactibacillus halophilus]SFP53065.1 PTS system, glucitol/sorbitol-specific IIC component [Halolactibacillus halophilus]